jgi:hypothetical protein
MKKLSFWVMIFLANSSLLFSQVGISIDGSIPDNSALLDVKSTNKGVLIPRLTFEQRNVLTNPAQGLMVFCTDCGVEGSLSVFSNGTWKSFSLCSSATPAPGVNDYSSGQIVWNWNPVNGALGYKWNVSNNFGTAIDMGTECSKTETGILPEADYNRYVWSYNTCSNSPAAVLTQTTYSAPPDPPGEGTNIPSMNEIEWNWNTSANASGYKWNTNNEYSTAIDLDTSKSKEETGLSCGTPYTRYVWAYNGYGYSPSAAFTQSTISCLTCGSYFTINHVAGNVAPVSKTVTYNTVSNVPGEPTHCWVTSNLGASHEATAKDDSTEASAGWYWQFNRKQGYKHNGITRTPNSTWIINIDESSDWNLSNDPCNIELGNAWRIPTNTEWTNVDASGSWATWNGPWNSVLKMHAAGNLYANSGVLQNRGIKGMYWSSTQGTNTMSYDINFTSAVCTISVYIKTMGHSIRCIRD